MPSRPHGKGYAVLAGQPHAADRVIFIGATGDHHRAAIEAGVIDLAGVLVARGARQQAQLETRLKLLDGVAECGL